MKEYIIKIPHLKTKVVVMKKKKGDIDDAAGYAKRMCAEEYHLVLKLPIKGPKTASHVVHEIIHILQYIVEDNNMSFVHEREHLAYIAGYLFEQICEI
jgi:hypothetical protein